MKKIEPLLSIHAPDPLKIECILHHGSEYPKDADPIDGMCRDMTEFFVRKFRGG